MSEWCIVRDLSTHAEHIPGCENVCCDVVSGRYLNPKNWCLNRPIFKPNGMVQCGSLCSMSQLAVEMLVQLLYSPTEGIDALGDLKHMLDLSRENTFQDRKRESERSSCDFYCCQRAWSISQPFRNMSTFQQPTGIKHMPDPMMEEVHYMVFENVSARHF